MAVGPAMFVLFRDVVEKDEVGEEDELDEEEEVVEEKVEVTDATTSETVMVRVDVEVEVSVRVELSEGSCAMASRGSRSPMVKLERCIVSDRGSCVGPDWWFEAERMRRCDSIWVKDRMLRSLLADNDRYIASPKEWCPIQRSLCLRQ